MVYVTNIWRCFENAQVLEGPTSVVSTHNNQICNSNLDFFKIKNTKQHKIQLILRKFFFFILILMWSSKLQFYSYDSLLKSKGLA